MAKFARRMDIARPLRGRSLFLFGPRQTGKSTLVAQQFPSAQVYDLLHAPTYRLLLRSPEALGEGVNVGTKPIIIDEIQRLPDLLNEVHRLIEKRGLRFLLTGSSARKLRRGAANLLGGRAWTEHLFPLVFPEIPDFDLLQYLNRGGLPAMYQSVEYQRDLAEYVATYLREEIVAEAAVRNVEAFARFLDALALANGEELNFHNVSRECGVPVRTVQNYVEILEDTLLGFRVPGFVATKKRKPTVRAKLFMFDVGVAGALAERGVIRARSELFGRAFEHWVIQELRAYLGYEHRKERLAYWRSTSGFEVDCVIGTKLALEVKATTLVDEHDLRGLRVLREEQVVERFALVSNDPHARVKDGITLLPWRDFADKLWAGKLW